MYAVGCHIQCKKETSRNLCKIDFCGLYKKVTILFIVMLPHSCQPPTVVSQEYYSRVGNLSSLSEYAGLVMGAHCLPDPLAI